MRVVHNSRYQVYFEEARTDMVRCGGIPYGEMEKRGMAMPVTECHIKFKKSLVYDEVFTVRVTVGFIKNYSIRFNYRIVKKDGSVAADGYTSHASINLEEGEFVVISDDIRTMLSPYLESRD
jgi:acyl-CoA thioester hydrolase